MEHQAALLHGRAAASPGPATSRSRMSSRSAATTGCSRSRDVSASARCPPIATRTGATPTCVRSRSARPEPVAPAAMRRSRTAAGPCPAMSAGYSSTADSTRNSRRPRRNPAPRCSMRAMPASPSTTCWTPRWPAKVGFRAGTAQWRARRSGAAHRAAGRRRGRLELTFIASGPASAGTSYPRVQVHAGRGAPPAHRRTARERRPETTRR